MSGKHPLVQAVEQSQLRTDLPAFAPGDTVVVQVKVKEGDRERLQAFEGVVIAIKNRGLNSAFTVRKISSGVGVERVACLKYDVPDLRMLLEGDMRFLRQF